MIVTYPDGENPRRLTPGLFPSRVSFDVADPPQAEERIEHEQAHPSALPCAEDWWWLPPSNILLHAPGWTFGAVLAYSRASTVVARREIPEWLLKKWEERPWWLR